MKKNETLGFIIFTIEYIFDNIFPKNNTERMTPEIMARKQKNKK